jgi:hypothetical protein
MPFMRRITNYYNKKPLIGALVTLLCVTFPFPIGRLFTIQEEIKTPVVQAGAFLSLVFAEWGDYQHNFMWW